MDELQLDVVPVILGDGLRFLEQFDEIRVEKIGVVDVGVPTRLTFRVLRPG